MSENQENVNENNETAVETSVTMLDILEQEKELEEESAAVLGGSDEKCCTYSQGYIKRQALYSCLTCSPDTKTDLSKAAGICLACSYQCHENHELIELYTKRNFRCDCPTDGIIGKKCSFVTANETASSSASKSFGKLAINDKNIYNQNFAGLYCTCHRPYPDPDDPIPDEMIQCIGCEDWYHTRHLGITGAVPPNTEYSEMVCGDCMETYTFLRDYTALAVNKIGKFTNGSVEVNDDVAVENSDDKLTSDLDKSISDIMNIPKDVNLACNGADAEITVSTDQDEAKVDDKQVISESSKSKIECDKITEEPAAKRIKLDQIQILYIDCNRPTLPTNYEKGAIFWAFDWRKLLCTCLRCSKLYDDQKASFLLDPEDTVQFYEENGLKKNRESDYDRGIRALSSMEHTQQVDAITEYNKMKDKLKEYLQTFVANKKVVTEEDINTFFQGMKNDKNNSKVGNQPHFCR